MTFDFDDDVEGWTFTNPSAFALTLGSYRQSEAIVTTTTSNDPLFGSFGFWESPTFAILSSASEVPPEGTVGIHGDTGLRSMYRTTFTLDSNVNPALAPTIRLRSSSSDFQQSDVLVITSLTEGALSPSTTQRSYTQLFSQPEDVTTFRLDFDTLNVDPADAASATIALHRVTVEAEQGPELETGEIVRTYNFADSATNGFTPRTAPPISPLQISIPTSRGLLLQGTPTFGTGTALSGGSGQQFGFWCLESDIPMEGGVLYRITFRVSSTATAANGAMLPVFRMRINDSSLQFSSYVNIDSRSEGSKGFSRVPVDGESELYYLYFVTPPEIAGNPFIFSLDYLWTFDANDDPSLGVVFERIEVQRFPLN